MAFRKRAVDAHLPADPALLYRMLAGSPDRPAALWIHQGDVLRTWHAHHQNTADIACELPTGNGKTLVGGIIGEWRRRLARERIAYLCPTKQLAQQTHRNLAGYGVPAVLLTGKSKEWSPADIARYRGAEVTAVTTYAAIFNSNPAIDDAQVLILDDAHAAHGFVADPWSLVIPRESRAYKAVLEVLVSAFDPLILQQLRQDRRGRYHVTPVHLASPAGLTEAASALRDVLEMIADGGDQLSNPDPSRELLS